MIVVSLAEFIQNPLKYATAVLSREDQVCVTHGDRRFLILADHTVSLIKTALDVASSTIDTDPVDIA